MGKRKAPEAANAGAAPSDRKRKTSKVPEAADEQENPPPLAAAAPATVAPAEADVSLAALLNDSALPRTVFVGNVPSDTGRKKLQRHFASYGDVESVRLRTGAAANPKMSQRAAVITGELVGDAISAYVVFKDAASATKAIGASGEVAFGRHLRVDAAARPGESSASVRARRLKMVLAASSEWPCLGLPNLGCPGRGRPCLGLAPLIGHVSDGRALADHLAARLLPARVRRRPSTMRAAPSSSATCPSTSPRRRCGPSLPTAATSSVLATECRRRVSPLAATCRC